MMGNKENDPPAPSSPPQRGRGRPTKRGSTPNNNVLGNVSHRYPHSNSPSKHRKNDGSGGKQLQHMPVQEARKHVHWEDEEIIEDPIISPTALDRNLEEQGIVGVYIHDDPSEHHQPPSNGASYLRDDGTRATTTGSSGTFLGTGSHHRTGLSQRRLPSESSIKEIRGSSSNDVEIDDGSALSPDRRTPCRRIIRLSAPRQGAKYSTIAKRRMLVMSCALGMLLVGYFFEVRQIMNAAWGGGSTTTSSNRDWLISLPRSFSTSGGGLAGGFFNTFRTDQQSYLSQDVPVIVNMEEERERVKALYKSRAEKRRMRTRPPSTYPTIPAAATNTEDATNNPNVIDSSPPPRLILDLPAHRELNGDLVDQNHRALQAVSGDSNPNKEGEEGRRQLRRKEKSNQPPPPICGQQAQEASQLNPNHYPPYAHVGPSSRIVVTGALSQVGMELILQLYERCGVQFIVGIDAAYPNTRHDRIEMIETRYQYIARRVPGFQRLIVPIFGIHPHPHIGEEIRFEAMGNTFDLVNRFKPTHVVHLAGVEEGRGEHIDYGDVVDASPFAEDGDGKRGMMRTFDSVLSMDQVLMSLARSNKRQGDAGVPWQPQLVYVSSHEARDRSGVPSASSDGGGERPSSVYGMSSLLKEVLASYYYRQHGVDSVGLRIPSVFGPFSRSGSLLHDLAERTVRNAAGENVQGVPKFHRDRDRYELPSMFSKRDGAESGEPEQMLFVYDVASAIMAAMQFRKNYDSPPKDRSDGPTLINIGSKLVTSMNDMKERMERYLPPDGQWENAAALDETEESDTTDGVTNGLGLSVYDARRNRDLLGWTHKIGLHEGVKSALAWQVLKAFPHGLPPSVPAQSNFQLLLDDTRDSLSYHTLPCASGCRWGGGMCSSSVWDDVLVTTKEITARCPYVLYTVDLRPELVRLEKQSAPSQRRGWEDWFCKIAFVSSSSKLAESIYGNDLKAETEMSVWNGKGKAGYWIIVALPGTQYNMPEHERSLAKLSPANLFNERVENAMYINHRRVTLTTDQAMGVMRHLEMKARKVPEKRTIVDEKTKENVDIYLPSQPQRHSVFFTNKYSFSDDFDTRSAKNLARFVMSNAGIAETKDIRAQVQFYEHSSHLTRENWKRSPNYQEFNQDNFFPYDFLRSTWLVHELKSDEGRNLRCEMYEEHALWGNSEMEDLSMGFVLAKRKVKMQLGKVADNQYNGPEQWYPLLVPREPDDEDAITEGPVYLDYLESAQKVATDSKGHEFYVTFLPQNRQE